MNIIRRICLVILVVALLATPFGLGCRRGRKIEKATTKQERREVKLEKLYNQALKDLERKKFADAKFKFQHILAMEPNYKDARKKLAETVQQLAQAQGISAPQQPTEASPGTTTQPGTTPPAQTPQGTTPPTGTTGGTTPQQNTTPPSDTTEIPRDIPDQTTPYDLLPQTLNGYVTAQKIWVLNPVEAAGRYNPTDINISGPIEFLMITVAKFENREEAEKRLALEKERFPYQNKNLTVNGHSAYFGLYDETHPEIFPYMSLLTWLRNNWFFSITVVPRSLPSPLPDFMQDVAVGAAKQMGY